jgi:hypothetical protein
MDWRCAWCEHTKPEAERASGNVTHGICPEHLAVLRAELAAARTILTLNNRRSP